MLQPDDDRPSVRSSAVSSPSIDDPLATMPIGERPSHYWTWRLVAAGLTTREAALARNLTVEEIAADLRLADKEGWPSACPF